MTRLAPGRGDRPPPLVSFAAVDIACAMGSPERMDGQLAPRRPTRIHRPALCPRAVVAATFLGLSACQQTTDESGSTGSTEPCASDHTDSDQHGKTACERGSGSSGDATAADTEENGEADRSGSSVSSA